MRSFLSERNIVVILFVLVLVTFALAQEDSKKMEQMYSGTAANTVSQQIANQAVAAQPAENTMHLK